MHVHVRVRVHVHVHVHVHVRVHVHVHVHVHVLVKAAHRRAASGSSRASQLTKPDCPLIGSSRATVACLGVGEGIG